MLERVSPTFEITLLHSPCSLPRSSDCCIRASSVPTLNSGVLNDCTSPYEVFTAFWRALRTSSLWPDGETEVGTDTMRYLVVDIVVGDRGRLEGPQRGSTQTVVPVQLQEMVNGDHEVPAIIVLLLQPVK